MKYTLAHHKAFAAACFLCFLTVSPALQAQESRTGTIKSVIGTVMLERGDSRQPARPGDPVAERDRIWTGPHSATAFAMRDGTSISVGPNSALDMTSFQYEPTKQEGSMAINLISGSMRFVTGLLGKRNPERIEISTPTAVVGIRGTDFILEVE